jgi:acyl dehydratase
MPFDMSIIGKPTEEIRLAYTWKDVALYALGVGAKREELDYLFEGRGPKVIPSFAVVPTYAPLSRLLRQTGGDIAMVVHNGQRVVVHKPIAPEGTFVTTAKVRGIYDLRRFGVVVADTESRDEGGELVASTTWSVIFRDAGGFGGETPPKEPTEIKVPKDRPADFRIEEKTSEEQALLYRLSGDLNPLHADPEFAARVGFERGPILHGLATYGFMVRHAARGAYGGDASRATAFDAQFRKPVWPGETLVTEGWIVEPGKVALHVSVKERDEAVLAGAWVKFSPA